jgi:hypothetical protein
MEHAARVLGSRISWAVHEEKEAVRWLENAVINPAHDAAAALPSGGDAGDALALAAKAVYTWARGYVDQLRGEGRMLPREGQEALLLMYRELKALDRLKRAG